MFSPDMFSGWGIRTLSSTHRAYNPLSYHLGTVWAVEQATIVFGLRRFGFDARLRSVVRRAARHRLSPRETWMKPDAIRWTRHDPPGSPGLWRSRDGGE